MVEGRLTRWVVLAGLSLATGVMFVVSMRSNYLFGYSLGQSDEKRQLFAWANVAADVWKAFGLIAVSMLWRTKHKRAASLAGLAWLMCLAFGVNSALGIYVQDRTALTGTRETTHATYKDAEQELASVEPKLRGLTKHRSVGEVEAAINAILGRAIMVGDRVRGTVATITQNCTRVDARTSDACRGVGELREEHATAVEARALNARATSLRASMATLRERGGANAPDPVAEFYAWLTRGFVSVRDVGFGFPLFFALLIETISAFGPVTIAAYAQASRSATNSDTSGGLEPAMASRTRPHHAMLDQSDVVIGDVVSWIAERAAPAADTNAIGIAALHADYSGWCDVRGCRAASVNRFEKEFDHARSLPELAGKIRKFANRYYGIHLASDVSLVKIGNEGRAR